MNRGVKLPWWADLVLMPVLNLAAAFAVSALILLAIGENPFQAAAIIVHGAFFNGEGVGYTLFYATNFIFTGLAFAVAYHAGLFNIGAEGQAYIGGLGLTLVCLYLGDLPFFLVLLSIAGGWAVVHYMFKVPFAPALGAIAGIAAVIVGLTLLTLGIATGMFWSWNRYGRLWHNDPKEIFALLTWLVYFVLIKKGGDSPNSPA